MLDFLYNIPSFTNSALILDYDDTLRKSTGDYGYPIKPEEIELLPGRRDRILEAKTDFMFLLGISNQSGIGKGIVNKEMVEKCFKVTNYLLDLPIDVVFCPHNHHQEFCLCRKPKTGLGLYFIKKYCLSPAHCLFVGDQESDFLFAANCGFKFVWTKDFFNDVSNT